MIRYALCALGGILLSSGVVLTQHQKGRVMSIQDGGMAYPGSRTEEHKPGELVDVTYPGLSIRDHFASDASRGAADALCDLMEPGEPSETYDPVQRLAEVKRHAEQHAMMAYIYADAMLKARAIKP